MKKTPKYAQIEAELIAQIESGQLAPGAELPSESDLIECYGVSRVTVRRAIDELLRFDDIKDIEDVNEYHKAEIKHFFEQYKALEPGKEVLPGDYWTGVEAAEKEIVAARQRLADSEK